jgi:coenzyme F420-reducing hydrogenase beta subunit
MAAKHKNVHTEVVDHNLCIGCGLCSICPNHNLKIEFNNFGEYAATTQGIDCSDTCDLCLRVCPFYDNPDNEDTLGRQLFATLPDVKHTDETGYYLQSSVGYSSVDDHRDNGASGGMATWMLESLLKDNLVDCVACVSPTAEKTALFGFTLCNTPQQVRACSRSCYYPVEMGEVVAHILSHEGRYAVIGLPCACKALRLAMQVSPKLKHRIRFVLGLVCGQAKSAFFVEYVCALGGGNPQSLNAVTFRVKSKTRPATDFGMRFACLDDSGSNTEGVVFWSQGMNQIWCDRYFTPNACNFCDDAFAECADAVFMDAWLPKYSSDPRGHNITLVRSTILRDLLNRYAKDGALSLDNLDISETIRSQRPALNSKRRDIKERIRLAGKAGQPTPLKRLALCRDKLSLEGKWLVRTQFLTSQRSRTEWVAANKNLSEFSRRLEPVLSHSRRMQRLIKGLGYVPRRIKSLLRKVLR